MDTRKNRSRLRRRIRSQRRLRVERLEDRRLLAVTTPPLADGNVVFEGDVYADTFELSVDNQGRLAHNNPGGAFNSSIDLDSVTPGDQGLFMSQVTSINYLDAGKNDLVSFVGSNPIALGSASLLVEAQTVVVAENTKITSSSGSIELLAARNIQVDDGAQLSSVDGGIQLSANVDGLASGNFSGILAFAGSVIETSGSGSLVLKGTGGDDPNASSQYGVAIGGTVRSTSTAFDAGTITLDGTGGAGASSNHGTYIVGSGTITTSAAAIDIDGQGGNGSGANNIGVLLSSGGSVSAGGSNAIDIDGTSGMGTGSNSGVELTADASVTTQDGDITISGTAGVSTGDFNTGVQVRVNSTISSNGEGSVSIDGVSSSVGTGVLNDGIRMNSGSSITVNGGGTINLSGQAGIGVDGNRGVFIFDNAQVAATSGAINIDGQGSASTGNGTHGVLIIDNVDVSTTSGDINIQGAAGSGVNELVGIQIQAANVSSVDGNLIFDGVGGAGSSGNYGTFIPDGSNITTTNGDIWINGVGGTGSSNNNGTHIAASTVATTNGNIDIDGQGGGDGTGTANIGVVIRLGGSVTAGSNGIIEINGIGGRGTGVGVGVDLANGSSVTTSDGNLIINGTAGPSTGSSNFGVLLRENSAAASSGDGTISITGASTNVSTANFNDGVRVSSGSSISVAGTGDINLSGQAGTGIDGNRGVFVFGGAQVAATSGAININGQGGFSTGNSAHGVLIIDNVDVSTTSGNINVHGVAGPGVNELVGIQIQAANVSSLDGNLIFDGAGGAGSTGNYGTFIPDGSIIATTNGDIRINGVGGTGSSNNNGTFIAASTVATSNGNIDIDGQGGGDGTGTANLGVAISLGGSVTAGSNGVIEIDGIGGLGTGVGVGVDIVIGASVTTADGNLIINGTAGTSTGGDNYGVQLRENSTVTSSGNGTISITGASTNVSTADFNDGVRVITGSSIDAAGTGDINLSGFGGTGVESNRGVVVFDNSQVTATSGAINIDGQGGTSTGNAARGVLISNVSDIATTSGNINISGAAGSGNAILMGVQVADFAAVRSSNGGDISISGSGGTGIGDINYGFEVINSSSIATNGDGNITVIGVAGSGAEFTNGVVIQSSGELRTENGKIRVEGTSNGGTIGVATGIGIPNGGIVTTTGTGNIELIGRGGDSFPTNGVGLFDGIVSTSSGNILIDGGTESTEAGVFISFAVDSLSGDIDIIGETSGDNAIIVSGVDAGTGEVTLTGIGGVLREHTASTDVAGGEVVVNGSLSPGGTSAVGQTIIDGNVKFDVSDEFTVEINGNAAGTDYDQLQVLGAGRVIELAGATLDATSGFVPGTGDVFVLIENVDPTSIVSGTFSALPNGAPLSVGDVGFRIFYNQGVDNNDVVLIVNDAPEAVDDAVATNEETAVTGDVSTNDSDVDGDALTFALDAGPANGTVDFNADGTFTYTPANNFNGSDSFTYSISDGALSATGTVNITVNAVNDAPEAVDDAVATNEEVAVTGDVSTNDFDVDGDTLTFALDTGPANGSVDFNDDGTFTYTPENDFNGSDSFTYSVSDGILSATGTVNITVNAVNDVPVAIDDNVTINEDTSVDISVLDNDSDADGDSLAANLLVPASNGTVTSNGDGTFSYQPDLNFFGVDSFVYTIEDPQGELDTAVVTITVTSVNDIPVAVDDAGFVNAGQSITLDLAGNDTDVEDGLDLSTIQIVSGPISGSVQINGDGTATYTNQDGGAATDSFVYRISDVDGGLSNLATALITIESGTDSGNQVSLENGILSFRTTDLGDDVVAQIVNGQLTIQISNSSRNDSYTYDTNLVDEIQVRLLDGNDSADFADISIPVAVRGGAGNDVITGGEGSDNLRGGAGDDVLSGGGGDDNIRGDKGDDIINGGLGNDTISGNSGNDTISGGEGADNLRGQSGNDVILGGDGFDQLNGGRGDDELRGGTGVDVLTGGSGNDVLLGEAGSDLLLAGVGADILVGGDGFDWLDAGSGRDILIGGRDSDLLQGRGGDDILIAGFTAFDNDINALNQIRAEWTSSRSYEERVLNLSGQGNGPSLNGSTYLLLSGTDATVFEDEAIDLVFGQAGMDWFFGTDEDIDDRRLSEILANDLGDLL